MGLILPNERMEAPELLYPGRKPAGNKRLDLEAVRQKMPSLAGYVPLLSDNFGNFVSVTAPDIDEGRFDGQGYVVDAGNNLRITDTVSVTDFPVTLVCKFYYSGSGESVRHSFSISSPASGINRVVGWYDDIGKRFRHAVGNTTSNFSATLTPGRWYTVAYSFRTAAASYVFYYDHTTGAQSQVWSGALNSEPFPSAPLSTITLNGQWFDGVYYANDGGKFAWAAVLDGVWIGEEGPGGLLNSNGAVVTRGVRLPDFKDDPYQFLVPQ